MEPASKIRCPGSKAVQLQYREHALQSKSRGKHIFGALRNVLYMYLSMSVL